MSQLRSNMPFDFPWFAPFYSSPFLFLCDSSLDEQPTHFNFYFESATLHTFFCVQAQQHGTRTRRNRIHTRDPNTIDLKNFDPIWFPEHTIPGHVPKDLLEVVGTGHGIQAEGSLRSLFWVLGMDEAVDIIDDPTTKLNDCLEVVPFGVDIDGFLINRYIERDLLPLSLEDKRPGRYPSSPPTSKFPARTPKIPSMVTETPATVDLATLDYLPGSEFAPSVKVLNIPNEKDDSAWASKAQDSYPDFLQQTGFVFRGVSLKDLEQALV